MNICTRSPRRPPVPDGIVLRRLQPSDTQALAGPGPRLAWIGDTWGGPRALAASGHGWGAFAGPRLLSLAVSYIRGERFEDLAVVTVPEHRRRGPAHACLAMLCAEVRDRSRRPTWTCSRGMNPGPAPVWTAGVQLARTYVHYAVGVPALPLPAAGSNR
ncbi:GNAT family N-acetyltransferase [Streptomyces sp. B8F3]|uniref:GNAT family N-acetyltransferase n=1 Tax=unclassified Streptomyces TaxID=2593676 RepID=UPI00325EBA13